MAKIDIDSHKLMYHPERVAEWKEKGDCYPIYIEIGLTNVCNHKCIFCGLDWARGKNILSTETVFKLLNDMNGKVKSICYSGAGEPLLHPDFPAIIRKTKESGIDISFSTNTVLFTEEIAKKTLPYTSWIRFSVDSACSDTHSKIHGTQKEDFARILENLKNAVKIKKENNYKTTLGVQFLLIEENANELLDFIRLMKEIGVDNVQIKPYSQNPNSINKMNIDYNKFAKLEEEAKKLSTKDFKVFFRTTRIERVSEEQDYPVCHGLPFFAIINEKGNVTPCHMYYDTKDFIYGNIYEKSFSQIWKSPERQEVLKKIQEKGIHECKKGCRLDLINSYLHRIKNPYAHDNFV